MKKIYLAPEMEIVEIKVQQMLASSPGAPLDPNETVDPGLVEAPEINEILLLFDE